MSAGCTQPTPSKNEARAVQAAAVAHVASESNLASAAQAHAHYATAFVSELNNDPEAALEQYCAAALADPSDTALVLDVSRRLLQKNQAEKAQGLLEKATAYPEASGELFARLGYIYSQLGKPELALNANKTAIERSPRAFAGYQNLVSTCLQNKQPAEAIKVLDAAAKQSGTDELFLIELAEAYLVVGAQISTNKTTFAKKALVVLARADRQNVDEPHVRVRFADALAAAGNRKRAAEIYLDLLKEYSEMPLMRDAIRAKLTGVYIRENDRRGATGQLETMLRDDPANVQAWYLLGNFAYETRDFSKAADCFSKALLLDPTLEQAYYDLAGAQVNLDEPEKALATLGKARERFPPGFVYEFLSGLARLRQKDFSQAMSHFTSAEVIANVNERNRLNASFYFQLGVASERNSDHEQAEKYFLKSLELTPDFPEALNYLGYMWVERGEKLDRARGLIEKALRLEPKSAAYLDSMGWVLFKLNQPREALKYLDRAIKLSEQPDATIYDHLGDVYQALKQPEKAREAWERSVAIEPNEQVKKKLETRSSRQ